ncbi:MAG TPA: P-loop NTPase [bacterium]|nr:P-loop NTPase [bacterium]HQG44818.1 P-loop NTPase [bacterium]HQI50008.1 P-loop NTPase [bacterium]HQJ63931.1 P-loop NTPase [bacterium]
MKTQARVWTIEHEEHIIGPLSSYALALWAVQGLLYPHDVLKDGEQRRCEAGYLEGMQPFIRNNGHLRRAKLWAIAGGKGGVGKSVLTALLGVALARSGKRVVIVDADFDGANQRQLFALRQASPNIWRLVDGQQALSEAALPTSVPNLRLITAPETAHDADQATILRRIRFIRALRSLDAEYVLLDFGPRTDLRELSYFSTADLNLVVSTAEPTALENLAKFVKSVAKQKLQLAVESLSPSRSALQSGEREETPLVEMAAARFKQLGISADEMMRRVAGSFSLRVLFNQVTDDHYRKEMHLLNTYLAHEVGVRAEISGAVSFDPVIRAAIRANRLFALDPTTPVMRRIDEIIHGLCQVKNQPPARYELKRTTAREIDGSALICGTWCPAWGECNFQNPGDVCPVKNMS